MAIEHTISYSKWCVLSSLQCCWTTTLSTHSHFLLFLLFPLSCNSTFPPPMVEAVRIKLHSDQKEQERILIHFAWELLQNKPPLSLTSFQYGPKWSLLPGISCKGTTGVKRIKIYKLQPAEFLVHNFLLPCGAISYSLLLEGSYLF